MRHILLATATLLATTQIFAEENKEFRVDLRETGQITYISSTDHRFDQLNKAYHEEICKNKGGKLVATVTDLASQQPHPTKAIILDYGNVFPLRNSVQTYPLETYARGRFTIESGFAHTLSYEINQPADRVATALICESCSEDSGKVIER